MVPRHIAIIMDGNGRWAKKRLLPRLAGHRAGADTLDRVMHYCRDAGVEYLTVYAFSTENWKRSDEEVSGLMKLLSSYVHDKEAQLVRNGVRFRVIGRRSDLDEKLQNELRGLEEKTAGGAFTLVVSLSYGGRDEIVRAAIKHAEAVRRGETTAALTEQDFSAYLDTADIPDPDLLIRTSGELRISNFLLWQSAYAEFYFTPTLWPDFDKKEFDKALEAFSKRERRLGARPGEGK